MQGKKDNVFITYAHTNEGHKAEVLGLAKKLRGDGVPAIMDEFLE